MTKRQILCAGKTQAARYAAASLSQFGLPVTWEPSEAVGHLLLDIPSFEASGCLRMGGSPEELLTHLPNDITVYGGNLAGRIPKNLRVVDFLQDEEYLAKNAYLTAECALDVALPWLPISLHRCPVLIIGWGRIGKCLSQLLRNLGAAVSVAARKSSDRAILSAMGFHGMDPAFLAESLGHYRLIFNTVPSILLSREDMTRCQEDCIRIDLASAPGMDDPDAIIARGLPGVHLPESSGKLIAETFLKHYREESL